MVLDETERLTSGDPWQYKKDMAVLWARKRLKELSESEKNEFYKDIIDSESG